MSDPDIPECVARTVFQAAINEGRCSELLACLFDGGSATIDFNTGKLLMASAKFLKSL